MFNFECIVLFVMYYDISEVLTGDLLMFIKYFNFEIVKEYKKIEVVVEWCLLDMFLEELCDDFCLFFIFNMVDFDESVIVK